MAIAAMKIATPPMAVTRTAAGPAFAEVLGREGVPTVPGHGGSGGGSADLWTNHGPGL